MLGHQRGPTLGVKCKCPKPRTTPPARQPQVDGRTRGEGAPIWAHLSGYTCPAAPVCGKLLCIQRSCPPRPAPPGTWKPRPGRGKQRCPPGPGSYPMKGHLGTLGTLISGSSPIFPTCFWFGECANERFQAEAVPQKGRQPVNVPGVRDS